MDPFFPAMIITSLCLAATGAYRRLRHNGQQQLPNVQAPSHDDQVSMTADPITKDLQAASASTETSQVQESLVTTYDEKKSIESTNIPSVPKQSTLLIKSKAAIFPPPRPKPIPMRRQYAFYKTIHHESSCLPTFLDKTISSAQDANKDENQAQQDPSISSVAQRYRQKPWCVPQSMENKARNTRYAPRIPNSHRPRQRHMVSSSKEKIRNDGFSISPSSPLVETQEPTCMDSLCTRQRLSSPELMPPPPPPRKPKHSVRPSLRRQNAFSGTIANTMLSSKRKRHLLDENAALDESHRTKRR